MTRLIGPAKAKELGFSGRSSQPTRHLSLGLLDKVVAPDDVYDPGRVVKVVGAASLALRAAKGD